MSDWRKIKPFTRPTQDIHDDHRASDIRSGSNRARFAMARTADGQTLSACIAAIRGGRMGRIKTRQRGTHLPLIRGSNCEITIDAGDRGQKVHCKPRQTLLCSFSISWSDREPSRHRQAAECLLRVPRRARTWSVNQLRDHTIRRPFVVEQTGWPKEVVLVETHKATSLRHVRRG